MMDFITALFGRLHPLLVHLPIGILFLAFVFECLSLNERYRRLRKGVQPALFLGVIFSLAAASSGYLLRQEGGYEDGLTDFHQNFGIATVVYTLVVFVVRRRLKVWVINPIIRKQLRILLFIPLILLLSVTGHWGGSLTHGEDYLLSAISVTNTEAGDPTLKIKAITNIPHATLYRDVIKPILEARCLDCHSSRKQKGELRLDKEDLILRGGKHGAVIGNGIPDSTTFFKRLMLPLEDEHHMPPGERPQLSSSEIALIKYWLEEEPFFTRQISELKNAEKVTAIIETLQASPRQTWLPSGTVKTAGEETLRKLSSLKINPIPLAEGSNYLMVNLTNAGDITDEQITALIDIKDQLIWLDLTYSGVTDQQIQTISKLTNLRVLYLNYTGVTDSGVSHLSAGSELRLLGLVGTKATDHSIPTLLKLENLTNLFLYQTRLTNEGILKFTDQRKEVKLDTGNYELKKLPSDTIIYKRISQNN